VIYFMQEGADGPIKIGHVKRDVQLRRQSLQIGNPRLLICLATMRGTSLDEYAMHVRFKAAHLRGEWFNPTPELMEFIKDNGTPYHKPRLRGVSQAVLKARAIIRRLRGEMNEAAA
jgi:hypothetical protein